MIAQGAVGALTIIKLNIGIHTTPELCFRGMILSVEFFFLSVAKKDSATALSWGCPGAEKDCVTEHSQSSC